MSKIFIFIFSSVRPKPLFWFRSDNDTKTFILADTVTNTETNTDESTLQKENLDTDSMGYFFHHNMVPKIKYAAKY